MMNISNHCDQEKEIKSLKRIEGSKEKQDEGQTLRLPYLLFALYYCSSSSIER